MHDAGACRECQFVFRGTVEAVARLLESGAGSAGFGAVARAERRSLQVRALLTPPLALEHPMGWKYTRALPAAHRPKTLGRRHCQPTCADP